MLIRIMASDSFLATNVLDVIHYAVFMYISALKAVVLSFAFVRHFALQICFKEFKFFMARRNTRATGFLTAEVVQESYWSSWSDWTFENDMTRQTRYRACCGEKCDGKDKMERKVEAGGERLTQIGEKLIYIQEVRKREPKSRKSYNLKNHRCRGEWREMTSAVGRNGPLL